MEQQLGETLVYPIVLQRGGIVKKVVQKTNELVFYR